jgi:hypothetical protein
MLRLQLLNLEDFRQDMVLELVLPNEIVRDKVKEGRKLVNGMIKNSNLLINQD